MLRPIILPALLVFAFAGSARADAWDDGVFAWTTGAPLIDVEAQRAAADPHVALKDPTIVFHEGRWHLFGTLRKKSGTVCMQYLNFADWREANSAPRHEISFTDKYHCAPQVFWFAPHRRWYLVHQCELIRAGTDERMEVDPAKLRFVFQGVSDADYRGAKYGGIPWRLGVLETDR
jgi:Glycosyl hydrolase family 62